MEVKVIRVDKKMPLPKYQTSGAVAFDFEVRKSVTIKSGEIEYIPTGVIVEIPEGYFLAVLARSSTARKRGLLIPYGVIDNDYCGPKDEIFIQAYNISRKKITVKRGERIAQGMFVSVLKARLVESKKQFKNKSRGAGSTG